MAPQALFHGLPSEKGEAVVGPTGFLPYLRLLRGAFPDLKIEILKLVAEGDQLAGHCRVTGTHLGPGLVEQITGRAVAFDGMFFAEVRGGQVQEGWNCFDGQTMHDQLLGLAAQPPRS
jgi:predicted ester cyclase